MSDKKELALELINHMNKLLTTAHEAGVYFSFTTSRDKKGIIIWSNEDNFKFHIHDGADINI